MIAIRWLAAMCGAVLFLVAGLAFGQDAAVVEQALKPYAAPPSPVANDWPKDKLVAFMRELTAFVYKTQVVTDPKREVYGMTYEFWENGVPVQTFSLDAMHDGAWLMSAMATAHRADPQGPYLDLIQKYQVPFYVNALHNSDKLFPGQMTHTTGEDKKPLTKPTKGWLPRGWDDEFGVDRGSGKHFNEDFTHAPSQKNGSQTTIVTDSKGKFRRAHFTPSNHLAQDMGDAMMNVWLTTHDPALAVAALDLQNYRFEYFGGNIPSVTFPAGLLNNKPEWTKFQPADKFALKMLNPIYNGMYQQSSARLSTYDDSLSWSYHMAMARAAALDDKFSDEYLQFALARTYCLALGMEMYFNDRPYQYGMYFFDLGGVAEFIQGAGKLSKYLTDGKYTFGGRGIQISAVAAGILPALKKNPQVWEAWHKAKYAAEPLVRIVDDAPITDGKRDAVYDKSKALGDDKARVTLLADPKHVHVLIESSLPQVAVTITPADSVTGAAGEGRITATQKGQATVVNEVNEPLLNAAQFAAGEKWVAELRIPNTVIVGQNHWINAVENGRYAVTINGGAPVTVFMLSEPERMLRRTEQTVLGTIQTWNNVWKEKGMIPSSYASPKFRKAEWEIGDAGNYAPLIQTISLWLMYQAGTSEWELVKAQQPRQPLPSLPLPDSVLQLQGLK